MLEVEGYGVIGMVANHPTWGQRGIAHCWILQLSDQQYVGVGGLFPLAGEPDTYVKHSV